MAIEVKLLTDVTQLFFIPTHDHESKKRHTVLDTVSSSRKHWITGQARNDAIFWVNCVTSVTETGKYYTPLNQTINGTFLFY